MKELLTSLLLGLVQGVTEFLPVSSSGHLALLETFAGITSNLLLLNVLLHAGTLGAICIYYRRSLGDILSTLRLLPARRAEKEERIPGSWTLIVNIAVCDAATAAVAFLLYKPTEALQSRPGVIGVFLALTGILLVLTRFLHARSRPLSWKDALVIGFFQGIAVLPGISRSGATLFAALIFTSDGKEAVRFSFLAAVPVLLGAALLETAKGWSTLHGSPLLFLPGMLLALVTGWISLGLLEKIAMRRTLGWFALYLVPAGLALAFAAR
jgi:undecaprenyl-diphosphatase